MFLNLTKKYLQNYLKAGSLRECSRNKKTKEMSVKFFCLIKRKDVLGLLSTRFGKA